MSFYYLATPYTKHPRGIDAAFKEAAEEAGRLMKERGICVFSPIAHCHPIALNANIDPLDAPFWIALNKPFMLAACGLIVSDMDGWFYSHGVQEEIKFFKDQEKPVEFLSPNYQGDLYLLESIEIFNELT